MDPCGSAMEGNGGVGLQFAREQCSGAQQVLFVVARVGGRTGV